MRYFKVEGIIEINASLKEKNDVLDCVTDAVLEGIESIGGVFGGMVVEVDEQGDKIKTKGDMK